MGLTLGCARCHDHKYDPFLPKKFYRLFAYFNNIPNEQGFSYNYGNEEPYIKAPLPEQQKHLAELDQAIATAEVRYAACRKDTAHSPGVMISKRACATASSRFL
jgi:hypothetical protein